MHAVVESAVLQGVDALGCRVEARVSGTGRDVTRIVGLPDTAVRESIERVEGALAAAGLPAPGGRTTINLAPADLRKEGPSFDLPIALALLGAQGVLNGEARSRLASSLVAGELTLEGTIRPVRGAVSLADLARRTRCTSCILPAEVAPAAALVPGVSVHGANSLLEVLAHLSGARPLPRARPVVGETQGDAYPDLIEVRGQALAVGALRVAAAGWHNLIMCGPPGTGKSTLARCLPGILPPPSPEAMLELTRIASAAGEVGAESGCVACRPFRAPHHTASGPALVGGGSVPKPGELTLAHLGVLFLDELPEFPRNVLDTLRQPLERDEVIIARAGASVRLPGRVLLVAAMNPPEGARGRRSLKTVLSGPLIDRIDLQIDVPPVSVEALVSPQPAGALDSATVREQVADAWRRQAARQGRVPNGRLTGKQLDQLGALEPAAISLLRDAVSRLGLSARAWDRLRRVARTIADLDQSDAVQRSHIAEAVQYRMLDMSG
ncbi:MAG: YifB family Mg chelatase-like AAA ATPase [Phycisphaerales bacterium]|nr:YifB family Mg chelatase-like AAA ATPase [Phycisphaerales bacterium]